MTLQPATLQDLSDALAEAARQGSRIASWNLTALNRVIDYTPEDLTVTVEAGITLAALQAHLRPRGQWLPVDPPEPERLSIGALIAANASGPRRFGHGTIREHLLGLQVTLADGRQIKAGGKVVKNVAGYDLCKLFVGSRGALGIITAATFKVQPLPETELFVEATCDSWSGAATLLEAVSASPLTPVVLDFHQPPQPARVQPGRRDLHLVLGCAGTREDVAWQASEARRLGVGSPGSLAYETAFWKTAAGQTARRVSVLPARLIETLQPLGDLSFVARAGNGIVYYHGGPEPPPGPAPGRLLQRIKDAYDPKHLLPELPL
ncbi:MAG: FAD-binding oxidoreductase [Verrucomicrobia bacterium]|nr:FAD-binding oxidoreductase [Verrucomicrobiota bacterium]